MRYLNWFWRFIIFIALLGFAVKNNQPVTLRYFFNTEWRTSLVVLLLLFFAVGVAVGVLAMMFNLLQQRREIANLKRDFRAKKHLADIEGTRPVQPT